MISPDIIGDDVAVTRPESVETPVQAPEPDAEVGGREGLDPTRYGDWEKNGRCIDF